MELQAAKLRQIFQSYYYQGQKYGKNADYGALTGECAVVWAYLRDEKAGLLYGDQ